MATPSNKKTLPRRSLLLGGTSLTVGSALVTANGCRETQAAPAQPSSKSAILSQFALGSPPWTTFDPFLFCVHHKDAFPPGTSQMGPEKHLLAGRNMGSDFGGQSGWNMYHGSVVPGFPRHPHRGFETVTITRRGHVDHSDSLGATARYGQGDVQWMTAGRGIVHAEMFPLLATDQGNDAELFQLWLNLPRANKFTEPHFSMFWHPTIPVHTHRDAKGRTTEITVIAGDLQPHLSAGVSQIERALPPPPHSWANDPAHSVAIWSVKMPPGASWTMPAGKAGSNRTLYLFQGARLQVDEKWVSAGNALRVEPQRGLRLQNGDQPLELLMLQGQPINEPLVKHGPFVMNDRQQIRQAIADYRKTQFGGWPWAKNDPVHTRNSGRFAIHADGRREKGV